MLARLPCRRPVRGLCIGVSDLLARQPPPIIHAQRLDHRASPGDKRVESAEIPYPRPHRNDIRRRLCNWILSLIFDEFVSETKAKAVLTASYGGFSGLCLPINRDLSVQLTN